MCGAPSARLQIRVEDSEFSGSMLQAVMVALLAAFIGLVIFMILAFDRPFRGDLGLDPGPYRQVHDVVMQDCDRSREEATRAWVVSGQVAKGAMSGDGADVGPVG